MIARSADRVARSASRVSWVSGAMSARPADESRTASPPGRASRSWWPLSSIQDRNPDHAAALPGAQRVVDFTVERLVRVDHASPLRWSAPQFSRFNPPASKP
ncbi:hypothetical protein [Streptomyces pseudogriseolus]|uniref:hypothetical protein n=2 Tax=Streptomyces pseudogriseolus TaxID=36817 RepID=UPI003FA22E94